jgi:hypothetical protein
MAEPISHESMIQRLTATPSPPCQTRPGPNRIQRTTAMFGGSSVAGTSATEISRVTGRSIERESLQHLRASIRKESVGPDQLDLCNGEASNRQCS